MGNTFYQTSDEAHAKCRKGEHVAHDQKKNAFYIVGQPKKKKGTWPGSVIKAPWEK
jgi:hypothetical protein